MKAFTTLSVTLLSFMTMMASTVSAAKHVWFIFNTTAPLDPTNNGVQKALAAFEATTKYEYIKESSGGGTRSRQLLRGGTSNHGNHVERELPWCGVSPNVLWVADGSSCTYCKNRLDNNGYTASSAEYYCKMQGCDLCRRRFLQQGAGAEAIYEFVQIPAQEDPLAIYSNCTDLVPPSVAANDAKVVAFSKGVDYPQDLQPAAVGLHFKVCED